MNAISVDEAKAQFSKLIARVEAGEEIVIEVAGKPVAKLVPYQEPTPPKRKPGDWKGKVWMSPDFDEFDKEIEKMFYEGSIEP